MGGEAAQLARMIHGLGEISRFFRPDQDTAPVGIVGGPGRGDLDGYICQATDANSSTNNIPSATVSRFLKRDVLLVRKGPRPRPCKPTPSFPDLTATFHYQDGYPLLVCSEESLHSVQERLQGQIGVQGVDGRWKKDELVMER